jgi:hypothetical protein
MIGRRLVMGGLAVAPLGAARAALPIPSDNRLSFNVIRKGDKIGEHVVSFDRAPDGLKVSVAVDIVVGLGPIAFFRYKHRAVVQWRGGQVLSVDAETNDDGTARHMSARRDDSGLVVQGTKTEPYVAPAKSLPGTHWNRAMLDAPFINTEDGRLMSPTVTLVGTEKVPVGDGWVNAQHFRLRGDANLDTFYDSTPSWVGIKFTAHDGSEVRYVRA